MPGVGPIALRLAEAEYARLLAAADVDLSDLDACRSCLVKQIGFEPEADWVSLRTRAFDIREAGSASSATQEG